MFSSTGSAPASGWGFGKIFFWVAVVIVALFGLCSYLKAQTAQPTQVISLLFHSGTITNPGDFRWEKDA